MFYKIGSGFLNVDLIRQVKVLYHQYIDKDTGSQVDGERYLKIIYSCAHCIEIEPCSLIDQNDISAFLMFLEKRRQ